jgi:rhodanese-related sulfurtransferase
VGFLVGDGTALERQGLPIDDVLLLEARRVEPRPFGRSTVVAQETVRLVAQNADLVHEEERLNERDPGTETVAICHHGLRSAHATRFLDRSGFRDVYNLERGLDAYSAREDSMPRY